ncbi:pectinesterase family protein [Vibrio ziniensis]|uniref:Pectin esterase n=1 Tax=Vibrio ziniensis TaxID=2711221 RepID=A0A6G7CKV5_9VIBR|nr:pectinesterase family protein [Vibrio ziniensis]QIH42757.1 pectin esterase [Vibrio ziniensis]QOT69936.1 pectinesterase [Vibrio ziniensis]
MNKSLANGLGIAAILYLSSASATALYDVTVSQDGSASYTSIQQAIDSAPDGEQPFVIYIKNGVYQEKLHITRPNIYLIGEDRDKTIITATTANSMKDENGKNFGTFGSRTVSIDALDFKARSLTIENGFDYPANQAKAKDDPTRQKGTQAVALLVSHNGDRAQFKDVNLVSYQDTLYLRAGRSYFDDSQISGTVDFIFGHGTALIENSDIVARYRDDVKEGEPLGYITAPATDIASPFGLVFKNCNLTKETNVPAGSYGLGRPWHPTTQFSDGRYADPNAIGHTAFINCQMDDHIYGWDKMSGKDINGEKIWFQPQDSRFWEHANQGKGATQSAERPQLNGSDIAKYTTQSILSNWQPDISLGEQSQLTGQVTHRSMVFPAAVSIKDSLGKVATTETDANGHYQLSIATMTPPLLVTVDDRSGNTCINSDTKRSICATAIVPEANNNQITIANVNPFSDLVVSSLADAENIDGPQVLAAKTRVPALSHQAWLKANSNFNNAFKNVVKAHGLNPNQLWDPVSYQEKYQPVMNELASQVIHNLGHNTKTGQLSKTFLADLAFRPIINLDTIPNYVLSDNQLATAANTVLNAKTRLFIVSDSTASNYPLDVYPRMGWGQAFASKFNNNDLTIVNAAQSGRSSRDFINGRWLSFVEPLVKPGDYLFIQFSHNDEKCDGAAKGRGPLDVGTLCTYPNSADGNPQFPQGQPEYSLQHSLERYLSFAKQHQLNPVMLTSLPRARTANNKAGTPVTSKQHVTAQNSNNGFRFFGDYTATVRQTAEANNVPLLDMQTRVIDMANESSRGEWQNIWLAVDPKQYPYYQGKTGSIDKPDVTHFQKQGAEAIADLVLKEIKAQKSLSKLSQVIAQ